jgi:hypothetical protein
MATLGRSFPSRLQGEAMEAAESLLLSEINSVFEDAIVFILTSGNTPDHNPAEELNTYVHFGIVIKKMYPSLHQIMMF